MDKTIRLLILSESEEDSQSILQELRKSDVSIVAQREFNPSGIEKACHEFKPDLVISDYAMAGLDGVMAMELIHSQRPELPFIFVSWTIHEDSVIDALSKGASDYVFKDQLSRLPLSVRRAIQQADERKQLRETQLKIIEQERLSAIGQMASGIAHDFSNSLMPVLGFTEILLSHPDALKDEARTRKFLELINTSSRDAMHIVGRLREFYRSKEKAELLRAVKLNELVRQTVLMTQPRWRDQMLAHGITIRIDENFSEIPDIYGNESALREALTNIIFNAVDALQKGGVISFKTSTEENRVVLAISDNGVGMGPEVAHQCFEPFFSTKGRGGTGLGLSMVYGVMKRHEGVVDVKSELGQGSTFFLRFPIKNKLPKTSASQPSGTMIQNRKIKKLHVLIVDDEPPIREVISSYAASDGHTWETAQNGWEGFSLFEEKKFDLVITDRAMPIMNGDAMIEKIKKISPEVPVIMVTGFGELMKVKGDQPKGVDLVLSKPLTLQVFRDALNKIFSEAL